MENQLLSLEQQFNIASLAQLAQYMSREQVIDLMIKIYKEQLIKDAIYKELLLKKWSNQ